MQPEEFQRMTGPIQEAVEMAGNRFARASTARAAGNPDASNAPAVSFVRSTADAAEHLAKLMLVRRGLQPARTHDLEALARQRQNVLMVFQKRAILGGLRAFSGFVALFLR